ncbi:MAG: type III-B CRISPR-associated protein Cas10/Cmr2, partial [Campylobacterota bacterium]|nr:type III-B CRISPR-associated protein Cas10/Cmr2 [Campylobacterota bacterium]
KEREFVVPYIKDESIFETGNEVGLFHDRFIFEAQEGDCKTLDSVINEVLISLSGDIKIDLEFLKSYLQINIVEKELKEGVNPILEMTPYLDTGELFYGIGQYHNNPLTKVLQGGNVFLAKDAFGEKKSFPSLPEIALYDLLKTSPEIKSLVNYDDESIYDNRDYTFKNYHKYYAIVHADGDSMGKVIEDLKSKDDFQNFSKKLFEYCVASHRLIKAFGGETIFAGGDDLLFFAPVVSGNKTIFTLCDEISTDFDKKFGGTGATLSFGVSIQYYKFPLYEALEKSRRLLFDNEEGAKSGDKNNIAFSVTKHSGQTFEAIMHKSGELYENFKLFSSNIEGGEGMDNFLHSIHHKIDSNKNILAQIAHDKKRVQNFFDNYFNKEVHDEQYREFFVQLVDFICESYKISNSDPLKSVYATLRFIKFVQGDK